MGVPPASIGTGSATNSYTSNSLNQMTDINGTAQTYDADGNLLQGSAGLSPASPSLPAGTLALTWNAENRLISSTQAGVVTTYQYDYLGRRITKTTNSVTTSYLYDGWNPVIRATSLGIC